MGLTWEEAIKRCNADVRLESNRSHYTKPTRKFAEGNSPNAKWKEKALSFVDYAHKQLLSKPSYMQFLSKRGISHATIQKYKLGFTENKKSRYGDFQVSRASFGLEETDKKLWIPAGYVIPSLEPSGEVIRIKIRRSKWTPEDKIGKYIALSGSMFGMTILGGRSRQIMVVVESELDAYSLLEQIDDVAMVIACGGNTKRPDIFTDHLVKTRRVFVCHDNDEGGEAMKNMWSKWYPKATCISTSSEKDIGEFIEKGGDLSSWICPILSS
jgi:DNA primase